MDSTAIRTSSSSAPSELAQLVIEVLDAQKAYFKSRNQDALIKCKLMEADLRKKAEAVLAKDASGGN